MPRFSLPFLLSRVVAVGVVALLVIAGSVAFSLPAAAVSPAGIASLALQNENKGAGSCSTYNSAPNSLGGTSFGSSCSGNGGQGEYWCADFAKWVWSNSGANVVGITPGAASFITAADKNGSTVHSSSGYSPQLGDAVVFDFDGVNSADHVGIVVRIDPSGSILLANGDFSGNTSGDMGLFARTSRVVNASIPAGSAHVGGTGFGMIISAFVSAPGAGGGGAVTPPTPNTYPTLYAANIRSSATTDSVLVSSVPQGTRLTFDCFLDGESVGGTTIWDHVVGIGYISDSVMYTGTANPVISRCSGPANTYPTWEYGRVRTLSSELASAISDAPAGTQLTIDCYVVGELIESSTVWDHVTSGGFISDSHLRTGSASAVVPACPAGIRHGPFPTFEAATAQSEPSTASTVVRSLAVGEWLNVDCSLTGETVKGNTIWDHVAGLGFVADAHVLTGSDSSVVPACTLGQLAPIPSISGDPSQGSTLTALTGEWAPQSVARAYQWLSNGAPISSATGSSLVVGASLVGTLVAVSVTGSASGFSGFTVTSAQAGPVTSVRAPTSTMPTISGTARVGSTLTAHQGATTAPLSATYQWVANGTAIPNATLSTFACTPTQLGQIVRVKVTTTAGGKTKTLTSAGSAAVVNGTLTAPTPTVSGTPVSGQSLTASAGSWGPSPVALTYQWNRAGSPVSGKTTSTYLLGTADVGLSITVTVTGAKSSYTTVSRNSTGTLILKRLTATPTPTVSGMPTVGRTLTASPGMWGPAPVSITYQWKRAGLSITGQTGSNYPVVDVDAGQLITVTVIGAKSGYATASRTSLGTFIAPTNLQAATPTISGGARVGQTLIAVPGAWAPSPVSFGYQWLANGSAIGGATSSTLVLSVNQVGAVISVTVTGTKNGYSAVSSTSASTAGVLGSTQLGVGEGLNAGQFLTSPNGRYQLVMQGDGNLVERDGGTVLWSTGTSGSNFLVMQSDGNLVMYNSGGAVWSSHTNIGATAIAALQDDSNFVVYAGSTAIWSRSVVGYATVVAEGGTQGMSAPTLNSTQRGTYPRGIELGVICYSYGQTVSGYFGSGNLWHQLIDSNFVPDVDVETGVNGPMAGEPPCGGGGGSSSTLDAFVAHYNGAVAVPNVAGTFPGQCVSLISQYLLQALGIVSGQWGNAVDYQSGGSGGNQLAPRGFVWSTGQGFQNGDILVWGESSASGTGAAGHIGIWYDGKVFDQNDNRGPRTYDPASQTYSVGFATFFPGGYLGYWRHS